MATKTIPSANEVAPTTRHRPEDLIDLARYPLDAPESVAYGELLRDGRARLAGEGALALPGFVTAAAVAILVREAEALLPGAYYCAQDHNPYLIADDPDLAPEHPRNRAQCSDKGCLADDLIPQQAALRALYDWPPLRAFIAALPTRTHSARSTSTSSMPASSSAGTSTTPTSSPP